MFDMSDMFDWWVPGRCGIYFTNVFFKLLYDLELSISYEIHLRVMPQNPIDDKINIGSSYGLVLSINP